MRPLAPLALLLAALLMAGSTAGCLDPQSVQQIPTNGLRLDTATLRHLSTRPLRDGWISNLEDGAAGSELLDYAVLCALGPGAELAGRPGHYGLAPQWLTSECDQSCQNWLSACLFAHANAFGIPVPISARGAHPGLAPHDPEFDYQEAGFYGDAFAAPDAGLELYACIGRGLFDQRSEAEGDYYLRGRICGVSANCGVVNAGPCAGWWATELPPGVDLDLGACEVDAVDGGGYADCHAGVAAEPMPRRSPVIEEVITVYLGP